jgi:thiol-disulfide isomerase/thioredoxin
MRIKLIVFLTIASSFLISSSYSIKQSKLNKIAIKLNLTNEDKIAFNNLYTTIGIYSYIEKYSSYYEVLSEKYQVKESDSVVISTMFTDYNKFLYDLYKRGIVNKKTIISNKIDTILEHKKIGYDQLSIAIDYRNDKKKIIFDENNNGDFSDDKVVFFNKDFQQDKKSLQTIQDFHLYNYNEQNTINLNRKIKIYPAALNSQLFSESNNINTINSRLMVEFCDYWKGVFYINNKRYDFAVQGMQLSYMQIFIKPESINFSKEDYPFNNNFSYKIKDTVMLSNNYYTIDSLAKNMSNLYLSKIDYSGENFGNKMGQQMKNYTLNDLSNKAFNLNTIVAKKQFTLIDFWGTWCKPCKELTPQLVELNKKYSSNLSIVSVAYDGSVNSVAQYTNANKMSWVQTFIDRNRNDNPPILNDLDIREYPTFILLDRNKKIIYRNSGKKALDEIEMVLAKYSLAKNRHKP